MAAYYNEIDPFAAAWLRNLIGAGLIPDGEVDERSILDVRAADLRPFRQHHFFAGIGGWPHALDLAGWSRDRPVWTGSPPCQPLSSAGQRRAHADERHLWPAFYELIAECRPATLFGEQVASKLGREWFAGVRADLEQLGYGCGGADLPAACVGAPHIRQRLFWVALSGSAGSGDHARSFGDERRPAVDAGSEGLRPGNGAALRNGAGAADAVGGLADAGCVDLAASGVERRQAVVATEPGGAEHRGAGWLADPERGRREHPRHDVGEHDAARRPERDAALDLGQLGEGRGAEVGWPSPQSRDGAHSRGGMVERTGGQRRNLDDYCMLSAGWATPQASDAADSGSRNTPQSKAHSGYSLTDQARGDFGTGRLAGWPTPCESDKKGASGPNCQAFQRGDINRLADLVAGWPTPNTPNGGRSSSPETMSSTGMTPDGRKHTVTLEHVVTFAGWPTPNAMEGGQTSRSGDRKDELLISGLAPSGCNASTEKRGALNPRFSLWLQGYETGWASCGEAVTASSRKRQPSSSPP